MRGKPTTKLACFPFWIRYWTRNSGESEAVVACIAGIRKGFRNMQTCSRRTSAFNFPRFRNAAHCLVLLVSVPNSGVRAGGASIGTDVFRRRKVAWMAGAASCRIRSAILVLTPEVPLESSDFERIAREIDPYLKEHCQWLKPATRDGWGCSARLPCASPLPWRRPAWRADQAT